MAWYLRIFPSYNSEIKAYERELHLQDERIKALLPECNAYKDKSQILDGLSVLLQKGYEIFNVVNTQGRCIIVSGYFTEKNVYLKLYSLQGEKLLGKTAFLEASICPAEIILDNIECDPCHGYGGILLETLLMITRRRGFRRITGCLSPTDFIDHAARLMHFYKKHGFTIFPTETENKKRISLEL